MIEDVQQAFLKKFDKDTMTCEFPDILDHLQGQDANFEMVTSNTIQTLKLSYQHNIIGKTLAVIFVATELEGRDGLQNMPYRDAQKRGERIQELLSDPKLLKMD